jgi:hypothetical protein
MYLTYYLFVIRSSITFMIEIVTRPIKEKRKIRFNYYGRLRIIELHLLGGSKGLLQFEGYQID